MKKTIIGLALVAVCAIGHAESRAMRGAGAISCGSYIKSQGRASENSWILGFLSAENLLSEKIDILLNTDANAIIAAINLYCRQHPLNDVIDATRDVEMQLIRKFAK